jgi:putative spermidine/putrescine transport system ATP-binding protein
MDGNAILDKGATIGAPLRLVGMVKHYGSVKALDDVTLEIEAGSFTTLLGPSGSGKTTLLMAMAGLLELNAGEIHLGTRRIEREPPHKRGLGVVFQNHALFPHMNVRDNIAYPLRARGVGPKEGAPSVDRVLELVRLAGYGGRRIDELSGGQRQRIALARALVFNPTVLLLDEPLSALDRNLREEMQVELRRLHRTIGTTMIMVTHDQEEALTLSDSVAVMNKGRLVQVGSPLDVYERPATQFVASFIGQSHLLPVEVRNGTAVWNGQALAAQRPARSDDAFLLIRPERLVLSPPNAAPPASIVFDGTVKDVAYRGDAISVFITLADGSELSVRRPSGGDDLGLSSGQKLQLALRQSDAILVPA